MSRHTLLAAAAAGLCTLPTLAHDRPSPAAHAPETSAQPAASLAGPLDPVERSRLRESAISALLEMAQSEDPQVRANAIEGLLGAPARLETVIPAALADPNAGVRAVAAMAVGKAQLDSLTDAVKPLLRDNSPFVRASAIFAMRRCDQTTDPTPLGAMVTTDRSPKVRAHAAYLLGELGDKGTSALLREAAQLDVPGASPAEFKVLSVQIAEALVKLGDDKQLHTLRAALYPAAPEELDATVLAAQVLGNLEDRGSEGQLRNLAAMRDPSGRAMPIEIRLAVTGALGAMDAPVDPAQAIETLDAGQAPTQIQAAWALGEVGGSDAVRALEAHLGETRERVRVAVAAGLLRAADQRRTG